ncbi:MarR family winged helix-turn-helix transcriptional regulator [Methylobacterium gossipiicola]|uniref:DNA-binding transcriptional regulator, MarR family n=1 Tax=Methylobacterium gossipiicola TaxID=582675 RepID=A0A1I2UDA8_9HYPH|nr:MarR family winged helix-turn-helix transcriptional regulator [Methylobacterium gossipiicola]SFG72826.1 DNA-binding transcriptional regulator, MarR family [Methylobacterium gossipiicola]
MTKPTPGALCTCLAVRQGARQLTQLYDRHLAPAGLRATQYPILACLHRSGPMPIGALAAALVMDRTTLGRALRPLEREGLVTLDVGRDARMRDLSLTPRGGERLAVARPLWRDAQAAFEKGYGVEEAAALRVTMARVVETSRVAEMTSTANIA